MGLTGGPSGADRDPGRPHVDPMNFATWVDMILTWWIVTALASAAPEAPVKFAFPGHHKSNPLFLYLV